MFPAETTASASPAPTARHAANMELSRFVRAASEGFSSMATTCSAPTTSSPPASGIRTSGRPKRIGSTRLRTGLERAGDNLLGSAVAAHRVDCDANPRHLVAQPTNAISTPSGFPRGAFAWPPKHLRRGKAERLDLAAPVRATRRADAVRALGLVALRALHERGSRELVRRSPLVAAGLGGFSLGDGHCGGEV